MNEPKSQIREWAEELADITALAHGRDVPVDGDARVVLTHEELCRGERAWQVSRFAVVVELFDQEAG